MRSDRLITFKGFVDAFLKQHQERSDRPFCFILGAGASRQSGIPAGGEMAWKWLEEVHVRDDFSGSSLKQWATADNLNISGFDIGRIGHFYPQLYLNRFENHQEDGYAFLESKMEDKEPSYGYSVLAYLLSDTHHKVVITTNFDNLVADALSIHSCTFPIVVNHDSLASYAGVELRRPLIAKVHGDLGFQPKNTEDELTDLPEGWKASLKHLLCRYTPIVIGYDGNDGSLMSFLENLDEDELDQIYWCFYSKADTPEEHLQAVPERVKELVEKKKGALVPIEGFDEMMAILLVRLRETIDVPDLYDRLRERARQREQQYEEQQRLLFEKAVGRSTSAETSKSIIDQGAKNIELGQAVMKLAGQRKNKPWWLWVDEAEEEPDPDKKELIYQKALGDLPENAALLGNYALFLKEIRKDVDKSEQYYVRALKYAPDNAALLGNYANFLKNVRNKKDEAEKYYQHALESDPKNANNLGNYALFLEQVHQYMDKAEKYYQRALEIDPKHVNHLNNYASFLRKVRHNMDEAERYYQRALEIAPCNPIVLNNYANFLSSIRRDMDEAEKVYHRALECDPANISVLGNYATFLKNVRQDMDGAEKFYKRALEYDPNNIDILCSYAFFLWRVKSQNENAKQCYQRALAVDSSDANLLGHYACFLWYTTGKEEAGDYYQQAIKADPKHPDNLGNYAQFLFVVGRDEEAKRILVKVEALGELRDNLKVELLFYHLAHLSESWPAKLKIMKLLLREGARSQGWILSRNIHRAEECNHPNVDLLKAIAKVITEDAPIEILDQYPEWKECTSD